MSGMRFVSGLVVVGCSVACPSPLLAQGVAAGSRGGSPAAGPEAKGESWAVVIGVNSYVDPQLPSLKYAVADARRIAETLTKQCGYAPGKMLLFASDESSIQNQPSGYNLREQVKRWLSFPKPGDTVLIFFSGHGMVDEEGKGYLAPQDCELGRLKDTALRTEALRDMLQQCKATQKVLLLDCCHAGSGKAAGATGPSGQTIGKAFTAKGMVTLASCLDSEFSMEWESKKQGLFTYYLSAGLAGAADENRDGVVSFDELHDYTLDNVSATAVRDLHGKQTPVRIIPAGTVGNFKLSRVAKPAAPDVAAPAAVMPATPAPVARKAEAAIDIDVTSPRSESRWTTPRALVRAEAVSRDSRPIRRIEILVNGQPTMGDPTPRPTGVGDPPNGKRVDRYVPLEPGRNSIVVQAVSEDGGVKRSEPTYVRFESPPARPTPPASQGIPYLGVVPDTRKARMLNAGGVFPGVPVFGVDSGSPAQEAGLQAGDTITDVGGKKVKSWEELQSLLIQHRPGDRVKIGFSRVTQVGTVTATLRARTVN